MTLIRKDRIWPTAITMVLTGNLVLGFVLVRLARADEHFAVEPEYYRKAVAWDSTMRSAEESAALGWTLAPTLAPFQAGAPSRLTVAVQGRSGDPIAEAKVQVEAFPVAFATERQHALLTPGPNAGEYDAMLVTPRPGLWELRVTVVRGAEQFASVVRMQLAAGGPTTVVTARPGDPPP